MRRMRQANARPYIASPQVVGTSIHVIEGWLNDTGRRYSTLDHECLQAARSQEDIVAHEEQPRGFSHCQERQGGIESSQKLMSVIQQHDGRAILLPNTHGGICGGIVQQDQATPAWTREQASEAPIQRRCAVMAQHG